VEIAPGIHRIVVPRKTEEGLFPPNSYIVVGSKGCAFVDTGHAGDARVRLDYWRKLGSPKPLVIAITHLHRDHSGGASRIAKEAGVPIVCGAADVDAINAKLTFGAKVHHAAKDGETYDLGGAMLEIILAPGHTRGSLCVLHREQKALFTGDNVMGVGSSVINPGEGDIIAFVDTMQKLRDCKPAIIYPGHGEIVKDADGKLAWLIQHRHEREEQIIAALRSGPKMASHLVKTIYSDVKGRRLRMAKRQVVTQVEKLIHDGKIVQDKDLSYRLK
jgi:glyoxylase-like metal-dependent hydrolase (beta-lactamase superfamily II)